METLAADIKFALRQLRKSPGFTLAALLTLGLGIGANTAIFSVVQSVLLRPLPFKDDQRLVHIGHRSGVGVQNVTYSIPEAADYQRQSKSFSGIAEYHSMIFTLVGHGEPDRILVGVVSSNYFEIFGIRPFLGRALLPSDDPVGRPPVLLLTHDYWQSKFGADPEIIGKSLQMNGHSIEVIGVLPPMPSYPGRDKIFISIASCPYRSSEFALYTRVFHLVDLFGRLRPGVSLEQAQTEVTTITQRLRKEHPEAYIGWPDPSVPLVPVREELTRNFRLTLLILQGTVLLVLLIACGNLASLTLARLLSRQREMVVRAVLGADRRRLIRHLLTESTLLSLLGGVLGLFLARISMGLLVAFSARFTPRSTEVGFDAWVLLFALGLSVLTGIIFGALPAFQLTRQNLAASLKEGATQATVSVGSNRLRETLVVLQVAAAFVLLVFAGLTLRSMIKLQRVDPGVDSSNVLTALLSLPSHRYDEAGARQFFSSLVQNLSNRPGVVSVAIGNDTPIQPAVINTPFQVEGQPVLSEAEAPTTGFHMVSQEYFSLLRIPRRQGRTFALTDDGQSPRVAVINETLARQAFGLGQNPIGRRISLINVGDENWRTIVGVVADTKQRGLDNEAGPAVYVPFSQLSAGQAQVFIRTAGDPMVLVRDLRAAVRAYDPEQSVAEIQTLEQLRSGLLTPAKLTATLLGLFALLAFVIAATGVSAVMAFFVSDRTQEIGIRAALGASRRNVTALVLRQGMKLVVLGLVLGGVGSLLLTGVLRSLLFGVEPTDPVTFIAITLVLLLVVGIACLVPARRATRIDPLVAMRS